MERDLDLVLFWPERLPSHLADEQHPNARLIREEQRAIGRAAELKLQLVNVGRVRIRQRRQIRLQPEREEKHARFHFHKIHGEIPEEQTAVHSGGFEQRVAED